MSGYYGNTYDRYVERNETSTIHQMKKAYWTTKQTVFKKLGKKEDEHIVASDHELDSKIEVFKAVQDSCMELLQVIERYQDNICALSQEENAMGRFLKTHSGADKTRAGKMMAAVGKSQSFSSQQRLALRVPLVRLYQEVETFRYRAISDTLLTINKMEASRTKYRAALMWMKDSSTELDPDTFKQLEKFRTVQAQVKKEKQKFDKLKLDTMQKIDLLAASRCNMFSHVLANYQTTLLHFWDKTSRTMAAVQESFKGYQYYEFNMLKELQEPNRKLAEETQKDGKKTRKGKSPRSGGSDDELVDEFDDDMNVLQALKMEGQFSDRRVESNGDEQRERLISFGEGEGAQDSDSLKNYLADSSKAEGKDGDPMSPKFMEFEDDEDSDDKFDYTGQTLPLSSQKKQRAEGAQDLLSGEPEAAADDRDDMTLLNEILNAPSSGGDDFAQEWQSVFGGEGQEGSKDNVLRPAGAAPEGDDGMRDFMPSHLLDYNHASTGMTGGMQQMNLGQGQMGMGQQPMNPQQQQRMLMMQQMVMAAGPTGMGPMPEGGAPMMGAPGGPQQPAPAGGQQAPKKGSKKGQKDMSAWFSLFADLDPLANPDAVGREESQAGDAL